MPIENEPQGSFLRVRGPFDKLHGPPRAPRPQFAHIRSSGLDLIIINGLVEDFVCRSQCSLAAVSVHVCQCQCSIVVFGLLPFNITFRSIDIMEASALFKVVNHN